MQDGEDENSSTNSTGVILSGSLDEQSMWVDEQIAEAEFLQQLEDSDSPVEATAQLSLPMFPDLGHLDGRSEGQPATGSTARARSESPDTDSKAADTAGKLKSLKAAPRINLNSAASMPELDENFVTPAGSPRKQAASAPPMLDLRFERSDSLASAASKPAHDSKNHSACRGAGGLFLPPLACCLLYAPLECVYALRQARVLPCVGLLDMQHSHGAVVLSRITSCAAMTLYALSHSSDWLVSKTACTMQARAWRAI